MKKRDGIIFLVITGLLFFHSYCFAQAPHEVAGFKLGKNIADYSTSIRKDTAIPIRHMEWLKEIEIEPPDQFKSGLLWYGTCASPGGIVRITVKYTDTSKKFFEKLMKLCKTRFGEPNEWKGDAFHIVIAWKWTFTDENGNRVGLILQHNTKDEEMRKGNSLKLTLGNLMDEESACFKKKHIETQKNQPKQKIKPLDEIDWDQLLPR